MLENPPIQSLWIGGKLSLMEQLTINSFINNGHEFHLYVYDEIETPMYATSMGLLLYGRAVGLMNAAESKGEGMGGFFSSLKVGSAKGLIQKLLKTFMP